MLFPARLPIDGEHLTARESEVVWYCAQGYTCAQIAEKLRRSPKTVERHKENVRTRFGLKGHHSLYQFAYKQQEILRKWIVSPTSLGNATDWLID